MSSDALVRALTEQLRMLQARLERELARGEDADLDVLCALREQGDAIAARLEPMLAGGRP